MKSNWMISLLSGALLFAVGTSRAQEPPSPDVLFHAGGPGGPGGARMEILGFGEMHPGKVVTSAPYSAVAVTESKQTLADGNTINREVRSKIYRDSQGRTRRETTLPGVGQLAASTQPKTFVMIHDPVAGNAFVLHSDQKIADQLPAYPGGQKGSPDLQGKFKAHMQAEIAIGTLKEEDLGVQTIEGLKVQGTRYTRTIPAGQIGNEKSITVTSERWYSPDLQMVVKSSHNDPRFGETSYTVTYIQREEPAATLFAVPSDYTVNPVGLHGHGNIMYKHAPVPGEVPPPPGE